MVYVKLRNDFKPHITRKALNKNLIIVLESSRDKLQEYVIKNRRFRLKN